MDALKLNPWAALVRPNLPRQAWMLLVWGLAMSCFLVGLLQVGPAATPAMRIGLPKTLLGTAILALPCVFLPLLSWYAIVRPRWLRDPQLRLRIEREGMYSALPLWQHLPLYLLVNTLADSVAHPLWIATMDAFDLWGASSSHYYTATNTIFIGLFGTCLMFMIDVMRVRQHHGKLRAEAIQRQLAEAQLQRLQAQLEPHMLFNTLSNLHALIDANPARAQDMLAHLIDYLRATLGASRSGHFTLAEELKLVQDYLALMQIRMGRRLRVQIDLPPALGAMSCPPMLLQPLVENAIQHGLDPLPEGGQLHIAASQEGQQLCVRVSDDGLGLPATPPSERSFGLSCVRDRLHTLHGEQASLTLTPHSPRGTVATVRLPMSTAPVHAVVDAPSEGLLSLSRT